MIPSKFEIDGIGYVVEDTGVVRQENLEVTQVYDVEYCRQRYDSKPVQVRHMSFLRAGFVIGQCGMPITLLDIGYGNGDFLKTMGLMGCPGRFGIDISGYPIPEGCTNLEPNSNWIQQYYSVACFFDSLEHIPDPDFLQHLNARFVVITVPFCHFYGFGIDWFRTWKHRRPGEHLRHFNPVTLTKMMNGYGFECIFFSPIEDAIRMPANGYANTFTGVFRKC